MKFAKVGYGSDGRGLGRTEDEDPEGYTYLVNDNVRQGMVIQPIATNWKSGKKFVTTGQVLHAFKEETVRGQEAKQDITSRIRGDYKDMIKDVHRKYGAKRVEETVDRYLTQDRLNKMTGGKLTEAYTGKEMGISRKGLTAESYKKQVRAAQIGQYAESHPNAEFTKNAEQTFEEYSKKYMD